MNFQLITNWTSSWKWISMQTAALIVVLNSLALTFPSSWAPYIHGTTAILGALTMYGRIIQQPSTVTKV